MSTAMYHSSASSTTQTMVPPSRARPGQKRTIYTMHSSRRNSRPYPTYARPTPTLSSISSTTAVPLSPITPTPPPTILSTSSSISFFPQVAGSNRPTIQSSSSRSNSASSVQSVSSTTSSRSSSITDPSTSAIPSRVAATSTTALPPRPQALPLQSQSRSKGQAAVITEAYRRRYASYLASTFNMSMDAALIEADIQLHPQPDRRGSGIAEAEILRDE